jgi:hypothetical protein
MNQLKAGGSQELRPRSVSRAPVGLTEVSVEAALKARRIRQAPKVLESLLHGYKRVQGGSERPWSLRKPRQEERCP